MKVFYTISVTIIVVCITIIIYTLYDAKNYRESLPDITEGVKKEGIKNDVQPKTATNPGHTKQTESTDIHHESKENGTSDAANVQENENDQAKNNNLTQGDTPDNNQQMVEIPKKKLQYSELQIDQKIAKLRRWLDKNHDNPEEIEEFLTLEKKRHESTVRFPDDRVVLYMTIEEQIRRAELLVKLYPGYGNEHVLNSLIKEKARYDSGEAIPQYMYPIEHWEKAAQRR